MGVSENEGYHIVGVLIIRILLFRVLYEKGLLFSETPRTENWCRVQGAYYRGLNGKYYSKRFLACSLPEPDSLF